MEKERSEEEEGRGEWNANAKKEMNGEGREEGKRRFKVPSGCHCIHKLQNFPLNVLILVNSALWKRKTFV